MDFSESEIVESGIVIISCPRRIDVNVSDDLKQLIAANIDNNKYKIILDLSETAYIDSSGLGSIVSRISVLRSNGGDIRLAAPGKNIIDLLELTNLNKIIRYFENVSQAEKSFNGSSETT